MSNVEGRMMDVAALRQFLEAGTEVRFCIGSTGCMIQMADVLHIGFV